ncbi:MAG: hypothetical protein IKS68_04915 [Mailhella sp.]|nr:hypothetical protein [Mailhella sp.]MBR4423547.1 hypothetical protein [Mailhella sp.]
MEFRFAKLETFIPESHFPLLQQALREADAGHIGNYDSCLAFSRVTGTWRPLAGSQPFLGSEGELCMAEELKVEVTVRIETLDAAIAAVKSVHPYEEPVINAIPLLGTGL